MRFTGTLRIASASIVCLALAIVLAAPGGALSRPGGSGAGFERIAESADPRRQLTQRGSRRGGPDHNQARDAVRSGRSLPLGDVIRSVQRYCPGRFLGADLQDRGNRLLYRVLILTEAGRRTTIMVDAGNGAIVGGRCK